MAKAAAGEPRAKGKTKPKPKLSNKERHKRFVDMAHEVEASEDPRDFDRVFKKVVIIRPSRPNHAPKASDGSR